MRILVTGGAGMIGSNLTRKLVSEGHCVLVLDNLSRGSYTNISDLCASHENPVEFVHADLSALGDWVGCFRDIDCVYHLADIVGGIQYVFNHEGFVFRQNLLINSNVALASKLFNIQRYVYVGTACSFPQELQTGPNAPPMRESQQFPANPESAYGWSKLMGELEASYLHQSTGVDSVVLSLHNVYGSPCDYLPDTAQVIPSLIFRALALKNSKNPILEVWGDGNQGRAFVHVSDVVAALVSVIDKGENQGVIQIGPRECTAIGAVARLIARKIDPAIEVRFDSTRPVGDIGRCADFSKAQSLLGWEPQVRLEDGIDELIKWIDSVTEL